MPRVTVLLPVYNAMPYLRDAVESLQKQTLSDFKVLVFDDGSTDHSGAYLNALKDPRFTVVRQENSGLAVTLNRMIQLVETEFIARLDADDICMPQRLEKQVAFMDAHPDVAVVGSRGGYIMGRNRMAAVGFGSKRIVFSYAPPMSNPPYWNPLRDQGILIHSTVMMRTALLKEAGSYPNMVPGQDLALWHRMAHAGFRLANMDDLLLLSRVARSGISSSNLTRQYHAWCYTGYHSECLLAHIKSMTLEEYTRTHPLSKEQLRLLRSKATLRNSLADLLAGKWIQGIASLGWLILRNPSLIIDKIRTRI
jgi:glycosyltransferase involved in cell wall biosynthesis